VRKSAKPTSHVVFDTKQRKARKGDGVMKRHRVFGHNDPSARVVNYFMLKQAIL
jgi:hypothetical protein